VVAPLVHVAERSMRAVSRRARGVAIALVYLLIAGVLAGSAALLLPSATEQVNEAIALAPTYAQSILADAHGWVNSYERLRIPSEVRASVDQSLHAAIEGAEESARRALIVMAGVLSNLPMLLLVPILAFFLLKDGEDLRRTFLTALPHETQLRTHRLFADVNATLAAFVRAQLLACVLIGGVCGIGFALLGIPYSLLLGLLAGVMEFIPLVGPLLVAIVASAVGALQSPIVGVWVLIFLGLLRMVEDYVIYPRLIGRGLPLHPLGVIVAVLAGAELAGVAGMFLAVPTVAVGAVVYRHFRVWRAGRNDLA
jgi:predicted PurR-regulated permease PerM